MGIEKQRWIEAEDRGWSDLDTHVCDECIDDDFLKKVVQENFEQHRCDYCQKQSAELIAAPADVVMEAIADTVFRYFSDPVQAGLPYDGEYPMIQYGTHDVLNRLGFDGQPNLLEDIILALVNDVWVPTAYGDWATDHEGVALQGEWSDFVQMVKHRTRFHFGTVDVDPLVGHQERSPTGLLEQLGHIVRRLGLFKTLSAGATLYRARHTPIDESWLANEKTMGAPPEHLAGSGRMNPAGIAYFYCALQQGTAVAEVMPTPPTRVTVGRFRPRRDLLVLDLCDLPPLPSIFDLHQYKRRQWLLFLHNFVSEITKPVRKDGLERVEYVPTQVVCEWFAQRFRTGTTPAVLDGLIYPSAVSPGGKNVVLFPSSRVLGRAFDTVTFESAQTLQAPHWKAITAILG